MPKPRVPLALAIAAAGVPMFMASLDNLVVTNALPALRDDLGAGVTELQWFVNAYTLVFAMLILPAVWLGDRFGRRRIFLAGIAVFTLASAAAGLASDPAGLIAARALQGIGGAALMPLSLALLSDAVDRSKRPLAIGIWGGISGLGVAAGPLIGGAVLEGWAWQAIFWINVPVGILAVPLVLRALPDHRGPRRAADAPGLLLAAFGVLGLVWAIAEGNELGWSHPGVLAGLIGGGLLLVGFLLRERRASAPLVPLRLFRDRSFSVANAVGFGMSFGMFGAVFLLIQYLQIVQGHGPLEAAVLTSPWTMAPLVVAPLAGMLSGRVGTRALIVLGLALQSIGLLWLALVMTPTTPYSEMVGAFIAAGVGMGLVFAPSSTAVLARMADADTATASGVNSTVREIGVALGIAVLTAVFTGAGGQLTPDGYVDAVIVAVGVGAAVVGATALLALLLPSGRTPAVAALTEPEPAELLAV